LRLLGTSFLQAATLSPAKKRTNKVRRRAGDAMRKGLKGWSRSLWGALLAGLLFAATPALADRTSHLFLDETQTLPEGDVELENWFWVEGQIPANLNVYVSDWVWLGPTVGITSQLEMSLPLVIVANSEQTVLNSISLVARYRFVPREQDEGFQPLLRVEYQQPLTNYYYSYPYNSPPYNSPPPLNVTCSPYWCSYITTPELKVLFALTYGSLKSVRATLNVGVQLGLPIFQASSAASFSALGTAGLGLSVPLGSGFRVAAEFDTQGPISGHPPAPYKLQLFLGPSIAWTRGQIWVTFGSLFGLNQNSNRFVPKVLWGITF
jgi:hypothetical protein